MVNVNLSSQGYCTHGNGGGECVPVKASVCFKESSLYNVRKLQNLQKLEGAASDAVGDLRDALFKAD